MTSILALAAAAALSAGSFDCQINKVAAISLDAGKATASMIEGLPTDSLNFGLTIVGSEANVAWPNSPIQANGKQPILSTGQGAGASMFLSPGPCLFTERSCANMFSFVEQPDRSLQLLITPTAISFDPQKNLRFPFLVLMEGRCVVKGKQQ